VKRTKKIIAADSRTRLEITIKASAKGLSRSEMSTAIEGITSKVMYQIPDTRYLNVPLSTIKVR
jgi:hypothetical protein